MAGLYSYKGQYPEELPEKIRLSNGSTRTDSSTFTAEEIADSGYTGPHEVPEYNENEELLKWNSETNSWYIEPLNLDFLWARLREERNNKLLYSDWTQVSDAQISDAKRAEWATYRQALRDLPANTSQPYPSTVSWPTQPE